MILVSARGEPEFIAWPIRQAAHVILWAPAPINAMAAVVQVAIGIGLMFRRAVRPAIVASVLWSLNVWIIGEAAGGLAAGSGMLLTGAPGAVLLYAVLAIAVWPDCDRPRRWLPLAWGVLWISGAVLQVLPGQASNRAIAASISANADLAPGWLRSIDHSLLSILPTNGVSLVVVLVILQVVIGLSALADSRYRACGVGLGILFALAAWFVGESLGTYWTGLATDPNSGPLIVLLAFGVLVTASPASRLGTPRPEPMGDSQPAGASRPAAP